MRGATSAKHRPSVVEPAAVMIASQSVRQATPPGARRRPRSPGSNRGILDIRREPIRIEGAVEILEGADEHAADWIKTRR